MKKIISLCLVAMCCLNSMAQWAGAGTQGDPYRIADKEDLITLLGTSIFGACDKLTSVTLPNTLQEIGEQAFGSCSSLSEIVFPEGLKKLDDEAFVNCQQLTTITLPSTLESLSFGCFKDCDQLTDIYVHSATPPTLDDNAFSTGTYSKATLHVPEGALADYQAADIWKNFTSIVETTDNITFADSKVKEICVAHWDTNEDGELSLEEAAAVTSLGDCFKGNEEITSFDELQYFTGLSVIDDYAFSECTSLTSVLISSSVTTIGENAFELCYAMTSLTIPASVTTIRPDAFQGMTSLTAFTLEAGNSHFCVEKGILYDADKTVLISCPAGQTGTVDVPSTVTKIGSTAFELCEGITSVSLPDGLLEIGYGAFLGSGITSISIPNQVTRIDDDTFYGCEALASVLIPSSVTTIGKWAFGESGITSINIPNQVTYIGEGAFFGCLSLTDVQIGDHVQTIGAECFRYCPIRSIVIPESVTTIGEAAFLGCRQLESAVINGPVTILGTSFFGACEKLTSVTLPNTLQEIGDQAFAGCTSLSEIVFPEGLKKLDDEAFVNCQQLTTITLPSTLESLSYGCFKDCNQLTDIYANSVTPPTLEYNTFSAGTYSKATLHVPEGVLAAYQAADIWKDFLNIVEPTDDTSSVDNKVKIPVQAQPNADVYDLRGKKVGSRATSLSDLPRGIYIVGGKKVVVR